MSQNHSIIVQNSFPGALVVPVIYTSSDYSDSNTLKPITGNFWGEAVAGESVTITWTDNGSPSGYWLRCKTYIDLEDFAMGKYQFSDARMQLGNTISAPTDFESNIYTLLPGVGTQTTIATGLYPMGTVKTGLWSGYYLLQAGFGNNTPTGYLSVDPSNSRFCAIESRTSLTDSPPATMVWLLQSKADGTCALINQGANELLFGWGVNGQRAQLMPNTPIFQILPPSLWIIVGTVAANFPASFAIRPSVVSSQNLNVLGGAPCPPGTAVGTWTWGGGSSNEVWTFIPVSSDGKGGWLVS